MIILLLFCCTRAENSYVDDVEKIKQLVEDKQYGPARELLDKMIKRGYHVTASHYRLRAECELHLGMPEEALDDVESSFQREPFDHEKKLLHMVACKAHLMLGMIEEAEVDASSAGNKEFIQTTKDYRTTLDEAEAKYDDENYVEAAKLYDLIVQASPKAINILKKRLEIALYLGESKVIDEMSALLIGKYTEDTDLHFNRGVALICQMKFDDARSTLKHVEVSMDDPPSNISKYYPIIRDLQSYVTRIQSFLDKRKISDADGLMSGFYENISTICTQRSKIYGRYLFYKARIAYFNNDVQTARKVIDDAIYLAPEKMTYMFRADLCMKSGEYNIAISDYSQVLLDDRTYTMAKQGLLKAKAAKRANEAVDYYAILNVSKTATKEEIKQKFRKLTHEWHPDKFASSDEKRREAELKMTQLNKAYEILSDDEKRAWYDSGNDIEELSQANFRS